MCLWHLLKEDHERVRGRRGFRCKLQQPCLTLFALTRCWSRRNPRLEEFRRSVSICLFCDEGSDADRQEVVFTAVIEILSLAVQTGICVFTICGELHSPRILERVGRGRHRVETLARSGTATGRPRTRIHRCGVRGWRVPYHWLLLQKGLFRGARHECCVSWLPRRTWQSVSGPVSSRMLNVKLALHRIQPRREDSRRPCLLLHVFRKTGGGRAQVVLWGLSL